jgi:ATP-dependent Lon protease
LVLTGNLGEVIKESTELGLTWVRAHSHQLGIVAHQQDDPLKDFDLHVGCQVRFIPLALTLPCQLHLPSGAVKKDGPSAGVGMVLAMVSLLTGRSVPSTIAVTGEITLRGVVYVRMALLGWRTDTS